MRNNDQPFLWKLIVFCNKKTINLSIYFIRIFLILFEILLWIKQITYNCFAKEFISKFDPFH